VTLLYNLNIICYHTKPTYSSGSKGINKSDSFMFKHIWQEIYNIYNTLKINCIWIKGHANNLYNERCDKIARDLIKGI
jgi:ribonuclease HI